MNKLENINDVVEEAKTIITDDFANYVNDRKFEVEVTNIASRINIQSIELNQIKECIDKYLTENKPLAFIIFFVFHVVYRRLNYGNLVEFTNDYVADFAEYEIIDHIKILTLYATTNNVNHYDTLIRRINKILAKEKSPLKEHAGFLNLYIEIICSYYERNLDLRDGNEDKILLQSALKFTNAIIEKENYHKYHLNKGRLLILLGDCDNGETEILKAINMIPMSSDRENRVRLYEQYLIKSSFIHAYNLNDDKYKELENIKINNYKLVALMTTLLGFLLGTINIFSETRDAVTLATLMVSYFSMLLVISGVILLGLTITFKDQKKRFYFYDISLIVIGIALFVTTMIIVI